MLSIRRPASAALRRLGTSLLSLADRVQSPRRLRKTEDGPGAPRPRNRLELALFAAGIGVVFASLLYRIADFPIYFFCDEAVQAVRAAEFLRDGFRDQYREYFPTFFQNGPFFNLSASVYAQVLPVLLFGESVFATRATAALIAGSASIAVALILRRVFAARFWWAGALLLGITPAWFLHSRTAFETAMATSFYAWFVYFYLSYRSGRLRVLYPALVCAALAFYTYSPMQLVVPVTGLLLLISDWSYHRAHRKVALSALILVGLLALPYARFLRSHPGSAERHMRGIFSYWSDPQLTTNQKLLRYGTEYAIGLSPGYWYGRKDARDLVRHRMKGYGNILAITLPFVAIGFVTSLRRVRSAPYRVVLIALVAAPSGAALASTGVTRALVFVVPAAILTALGVDAVAGVMVRRVGYLPVAVALFGVLAAGQLAILRDALVNGPTWYRDYGLGGMQYGARQVFGEIKQRLRRDPQLRFDVSPIWANGANELRNFFVGDDARVAMHNLEWYLVEKRPELGPNRVLVLTPDEHRQAISDPRFTVVRNDGAIRYPDGSDGFHFSRLAYAPDFDERTRAEREARHALVPDFVSIGGETVAVMHSRLDMGELRHAFDGDRKTLTRTDRANPAVFDLVFGKPRVLRGVTVTTGSGALGLSVRVWRQADGSPLEQHAEFRKLPPDPTVHLALPPGPVARLRIEITLLNSLESEWVHVREVRLE